MNISNFIKSSNNGFLFLNYGELQEKERSQIKSSLKNNYQFFLSQQIPTLLLNGIFKHYYKLTDIEMLFIFLIISNKNCNLSNIKETDFVFYNEYFKTIISQDRKINEIINNLANKEFIEIKPIIKNGKNKGRYIDFSKTIMKHNKLFEKLTKQQIEESEDFEINPVIIKTYLKNIRENFTFKNGKIKKSLDTHEKEKLLEIKNEHIFNSICLIPLFLAERKTDKEKIESGNKSPLLYFFKNYEILIDDFYKFEMSNFEIEEIESIEETTENEKEIDSLLSLI